MGIGLVGQGDKVGGMWRYGRWDNGYGRCDMG